MLQCFASEPILGQFKYFVIWSSRFMVVGLWS